MNILQDEEVVGKMIVLKAHHFDLAIFNQSAYYNNNNKKKTSLACNAATKRVITDHCCTCDCQGLSSSAAESVLAPLKLNIHVLAWSPIDVC